MIPEQQDFQTLLLDRRGEALHVMLHRPEVLNALNDTVLNELTDLFTGLSDVAEIRVVVLGGAGRCFTSGADRKDLPGRAGDGVPVRYRRWVAKTGLRACRSIAEARQVTIARTHGHVIGGGVLLATSCDFRAGAPDTMFCLPEIELGLPLAWGGVPLLISELGAAKARELIILCEQVDATEAARIGLLHTVAADLDSTVDSMVQRVLGLPDYSVQTTKRQFRGHAAAGWDSDLTEAETDSYAAALAELADRR